MQKEEKKTGKLLVVTFINSISFNGKYDRVQTHTNKHFSFAELFRKVGLRKHFHLDQLYTGGLPSKEFEKIIMKKEAQSVIFCDIKRVNEHESCQFVCTCGDIHNRLLLFLYMKEG